VAGVLLGIGLISVGLQSSGTRASLWRSSAPSSGGGDAVPVSMMTLPAEATEDFGRRLIAQTAELLGPDQADPQKRYINSRLNCGS
jgi:hypothetical protein